MRLFLVQHGEAKDETEDPARPLNDVGVQNTELVAAWLGNRSIKIAQIQHSGKKRSQQTAEIFARHLSPAPGVAAASGLSPSDDVRPMAAILSELRDSRMIVGHLPFLDRLASLLLAGDPEIKVVRFRNSGVVCLLRDDGRWSLAWSVVPSVLSCK